MGGGGKFVGISKKTWVSAYLRLGENDLAIKTLQELVNGPIPMELVDGEMPEQFNGLERSVCRVDSTTGPFTIPSLWWELFRSKNLEGEMLPPTRAALLPHIACVNYISMRDKSYTTTCPNLPPIEDNGWSLENGVYVPAWQGD